MKQIHCRAFTAIFVALLLLLSPVSYGAPLPWDGLVQGLNQGSDAPEELKKAALSATITAIELEMNRYQRWIDVRKGQGDQAGEAAMQAAWDELKIELDMYKAMDWKDYPMPRKVETVVWTEGQAGIDTIVYVEGMSRSGPWYHLAGIMGDDFAALKPGVKVPAALYAVHKRTYGSMHSAYVFLDLPQAVATEGKTITGTVYERNQIIPFGDIEECNEYQVYLLKEPKSGAPGELILQSKKAPFTIKLSQKQLEKYPYIEFVSAFSSKMMKISDLGSKPAKIVLERDVVLKKPAIYLYPEKKQQIEVTHHFKGKLLTTYPLYAGKWTVIADPSGDLYNAADKRSYKYLFWDGLYTFSPDHYNYDTGFYVNRKDYASFLQTKLADIGLTENEINDFVVYWLPAMNRYRDCFVHFRINDNIGGSSELVTKPAADTVIRVFMEFYGIADLAAAPKVAQQQLPSFIRKGFTLVEWGGTEICSGKVE